MYSFKKTLLINHILRKREENAKIIQRIYQKYNYAKIFNQILEKEKSNFTLYFLSRDTNELHIKFRAEGESEPKVFKFDFCKLRKIHVVYFPKKDFQEKEYFVNFIVDGLTTCDSRFPTVYLPDGGFFNKINFKLLIHHDSDSDSSLSDQHYDESIANDKSFKFNIVNIERYKKKFIEEVAEEKSIFYENKNTFSVKKKYGSIENLKKSSFSVKNLKKLENSTNWNNKKHIFISAKSSWNLKEKTTKSILRKDSDIMKCKSSKKVLVSKNIQIFTYQN